MLYTHIRALSSMSWQDWKLSELRHVLVDQTEHAMCITPAAPAWRCSCYRPGRPARCWAARRGCLQRSSGVFMG